ncbi:hypothetical protein LOC67_11730 [Stieleria sp. JC731]|uniref:hypothetical protein n=1 Tax=Pirellulaceae TaxID=2691357 RepID=UPI001E38825B|nr:hypothetical protein [Stieleria sp. JC731]MCC9601217.1 hypothetical protein [Stieleria sp. JC731]
MRAKVSITEPLTPAVHRSDHSGGMAISRFDAVTSFLLTLALMLLVGVLTLFVLWLGTKIPSPLHQPNEIDRITTASSSFGAELEFELPTESEVSDLARPDLSEALVAVSNITAKVSSATAIEDSAGQRDERGNGPSEDARETGPNVEDHSVIPKWERWELRFDSSSREDYARQLDFFSIELAAFGGGENKIESAVNVSTEPRRIINEDPQTEQRLYFSWRRKTVFSTYDRQLLTKAGIVVTERSIVRLIPAELEMLLTNLELQCCERNSKPFPASIAKTIFKCERDGNGYEFKILQQRYR